MAERQTILQVGTGNDLFAYFHIGATYIKDEAKTATSDTVVVELWGNGTNAYRPVIPGYGGWKAYVDGVAKRVGKPKFEHVCLTTWSAGSQIIKTVCRGAPNEQPDAIVSCDGLYGNKPPGSKPGDGNVAFDAEIEAVARYALAAAKGEKIFVLLHSMIATPYGSSSEVAMRIRRYVEEQMGREMEPDSLTPAELGSHQFTEALVLGSFHLIEFPGRDGAEHVREAHLFDEVWRRWIPWANNDHPKVADTEPAPPPTQPGPPQVFLPTEIGEGSRGPEVQAWQNFLIGQGQKLKADGVFGPITAGATRGFQLAVGSPKTGRVDAATRAAARRMGFGEPEPSRTQNGRGPEWPPKPDFAPLVGNAARAAVFGPFAYRSAPTPSNPEAIVITDGWEKANIRLYEIPQLRGLPGAPKNALFEFHRLCGPIYVDFFADVEKRGFLNRIKTVDGAKVSRYIRGSRSVLSNHAYGSAIDLNYRWNQLGRMPALVGEEGSLRELVPIMHEHGIYWGGHFSVDEYGRMVFGPNGEAPRTDGAHLEVAKPRKE
jgi:hypothetical protein